jgi:signal transduction histidine kinase
MDAVAEFSCCNAMSADIHDNAPDLDPNELPAALPAGGVTDSGGSNSGFIGDLAHELHTPLNAIMGFSEFLLDEKPGPLNPLQKEYLGDVLNSGRELLQLVNDVVELSKLEAGQIQLAPEIFDVSEAFSQVLTAASEPALHEHICLRAHLESDLGKVELDRNRTLQIFNNLLGHALKFARERGEIEVTARLEQTGEPNCAAGLCVLIAYSGSGLRKADFHMALTRKLVEMQGGVLTVDVDGNRRSVMRVVLPLHS